MNLVQIRDTAFPAVLAVTEEEQERGLMYVTESPPVMAFIYAKPSINKMWMRNTYVPLDIVFCRNGKIVALATGKPHSEELIGPDVVTDVVIEFPAGSIQQFGFEVGHPVEMVYDVPSLGRVLAESRLRIRG